MTQTTLAVRWVLPRLGGVVISGAAGIVAGLLAITSALSLSSLIFSGPLAPWQPQGLAIALTGTVVLAAVVALTSSLPFAIGGPDSGSAAVLAVLAAGVVREAGPTAASGATAAFALALAAVVAGLILLVLGLLRLGQMVRFVPYPVVAGFLSASGLVLLLGGLRVGGGVPFSWDMLPGLAAAWPRLAASGAVALLLLALAPRVNHATWLFGLLAAATLAHHAVFALAGVSADSAIGGGWLMHPPGGMIPPQRWSMAAFGSIDWGLLWRHAAEFATVGLIAAMTIMLGVSVLEVDTAQDADIDRELVAGGVSNLLSGLLGGMPGALSASRTTVVWRAGARGRLTGLVAAGCAGLALFYGAALARAVPTTVIAGMLGYMGLDTVRNWIIYPRRRLGMADWLSSVVIAAIILRFGFVMGVAAGLLLGCVSFAVSYSRIPAVRLQYNGAVARSRVQRSPEETERLGRAAGQLLVLHLQGYLFFGTASLLLGRIRRALRQHVPPGMIILECSAVDDVDNAAINALLRLLQVTARADVALVVAGLSPRLLVRLAAARLDGDAGLKLFPKLDDALEWYEDRALAGSEDGGAAVSVAEGFFPGETLAPAAVAAFACCLETVDMAPGAVLMRQGEASDDLFLVQSGRLTVRVQRDAGVAVRARSFGAGAMVGELAFHLGAARTATVVADRPTRAWRLTRLALAGLERDAPGVAMAFHRGMARLLSRRLMETATVINALLDAPPAG